MGEERIEVASAYTENRPETADGYLLGTGSDLSEICHTEFLVRPSRDREER